MEKSPKHYDKLELAGVLLNLYGIELGNVSEDEASIHRNRICQEFGGADVRDRFYDPPSWSTAGHWKAFKASPPL